MNEVSETKPKTTLQNCTDSKTKEWPAEDLW